MDIETADFYFILAQTAFFAMIVGFWFGQFAYWRDLKSGRKGSWWYEEKRSEISIGEKRAQLRKEIREAGKKKKNEKPWI